MKFSFFFPPQDECICCLLFSPFIASISKAALYNSKRCLMARSSVFFEVYLCPFVRAAAILYIRLVGIGHDPVDGLIFMYVNHPGLLSLRNFSQIAYFLDMRYHVNTLFVFVYACSYRPKGLLAFCYILIHLVLFEPGAQASTSSLLTFHALRTREANLVGIVDEDFPPLGSIPKDKHSGNNPPLRRDTSTRSGTSTLPPGLPLPHTHPTSLARQNASGPSGSSPSVSNAASGQPPRAPKQISCADAKDEPLSSKTVSDVSLGSPVQKSVSSKSDRTEEFSNTADNQGDSIIEKDENIPVNPVKLGLQVNVDSASGRIESTMPTAGSRPNTPLTGVSRVSDSSSVRQHPRILRVVETPRNETPSPSPTQSISSSVQVKKHSRRPSVSSLMSRPDTPGDFASDAGDPPSYTSASVSRANSPPHTPASSIATSRIGSAPVRAVSKSQAKKERRQKAKDAEAKKFEEAAAASTHVAEAVQAPIVGRKRKTKKTVVPSNSNNASESQGYSGIQSSNLEANKENNEMAGDSKTTITEGKPSNEAEHPAVEDRHVPSAPPAVNTIEQVIEDSEASGIPINDLFVERTSSLQKLLAQLHKSSDIDLNEHPLFNPPNLGQRVDMKCSATDYKMLKHPIELTAEDGRALLRGEPVRILRGRTGQQKGRCLITPRGCILPHLSPKEEERYLALEESINRAAGLDPFPEYPVDLITEPDTTNRVGGLDALCATPEHFNVLWVHETASSSGDSTKMPMDVLEAGADNNTDELVDATAASVRSFAAATGKHMLGATGMTGAVGSMPDLCDVIGMTDDELRSFALKSQKELDVARKELDAVDKRLSGLVKRNKKLAQQALASEC